MPSSLSWRRVTKIRGATCGRPKVKTSCARSTPPDRRSPPSSPTVTLFQRRHTSGSQPPKRPTENELSDFSLLWHEGCEKQSTGHKMWTEITRRKFEREGQRYTSDVTDAEWALIDAPICRRPSLWAGRARLSCERCLTRSCISRGPAVSGGCCRRTLPRSP